MSSSPLLNERERKSGAGSSHSTDTNTEASSHPSSAFSRKSSSRVLSMRSEAQEALESSVFGAGKTEYHRRQRETQECLKDVDRFLKEEAQGGLSVGEGGESRECGESRDKWAVSISNYVNVVLFFFKLYASVVTHSLAIIASTLDSLLDILAGCILWYTTHAMSQHDPEKYPVGKRRMQPVGIIIFAAVMATLGFQVLLQGVTTLIEGPGEDEVTHISTELLHWVVGILAAVIAAKIGLYLFCRTSKSDIVQAYATDHFLDVVTNAVGMVSAILGSRLAWWVDPLGAIAIALYTIVNWSRTVLENAESLIGVSASPEFLAKVLQISSTHDRRIRRIESIRAWLLGSHYIVEVDIELPGDMALREGHDIGETLQNKLEELEEVDRAFVHLDHEGHHLPEHVSGGGDSATV